MAESNSTRNRNDRIAESIAGIESEMKRIGYWSAEPLPAQAYQFTAAFAWIRWRLPNGCNLYVDDMLNGYIEVITGYRECILYRVAG